MSNQHQARSRSRSGPTRQSRAPVRVQQTAPRGAGPNSAALQRRLGNRGTQAWLVEQGGAQAEQQVQAKLSAEHTDNMYEQEDRDRDDLLQGKFELERRLRPEDKNSFQRKYLSNSEPTHFQGGVDKTENHTGMPSNLKAGLEQLSGVDLSSVRVHYNSSKPVQLNASAYTQGQDIHVGPGHEKHLPHEGWHAVQQMQGHVEPTMQAKGASINDDKELEREADVMGAKALQMTRAEQSTTRLAHQGSIPLQRALQLDLLEDYNVWPITGGKAGRVWLGAIPDLVYEKANYSNTIGWWQSWALAPTLTENAYEYITRLTPSLQEIIRWTGKPGTKTTNITTKRLKKAPPSGPGSSYRHVFGSTVGAYADIDAYTDFKVNPLVVNTEFVDVKTLSDYSNMIPIQSTGGTNIVVRATTSDILHEGYSVSKSRGQSNYLASEITSSIGADLGVVAVKIESSIEAKKTISNTVSSNADFTKEVAKGEGITITIDATGTPINKVAIPSYKIVTLKLETRRSTAAGVDTESTETNYVHHIRPTGQYDILDAVGQTDVEPKLPPTKEGVEAYKEQKEGEETPFKPVDPNSVIHSIKMVAKHEAVKNYADQVRVTGDGLDKKGKDMLMVADKRYAVKVTNGLRYTTSSSVSKEINASIKSQIGLGEAVTKATGISASVGGKISSGESITKSVEKSISVSRSSEFTISDEHTAKVPPFKRSSLYLTPLVKVTSYAVTLINGKTLYVHSYAHQPVRHSHVYTTPKGILHPEKWIESRSAPTGPEKLEPSSAQKRAATSVKELRKLRDAESDPKKKEEYANQIEFLLKSVRDDQVEMVKKVHPTLEAIDPDNNLYKITLNEREYFGTLEVLADLSAPSEATLAAGKRLFSKGKTEADGTKIEVAGGLGGTGAQGRVNPFPGDIDLSEQIKVTAATPDAASQALARTIQQTVRDATKPTTEGKPPMQFLRLTCGAYPPDSTKPGSVLGWTHSQVTAGSQTYKKKDGGTGTITLAEAFASPNPKAVVNTFWRGPVDSKGSFGEITKVMAYEAINKDTGKTMFATPKIGQTFQEGSFEKPVFHDTERMKLMDALSPQIADKAKEGNWVKATKRALTVARMGGDFEAVNDFSPLLRSSHSALKTITEHTDLFNEEVINNRKTRSQRGADPDVKEVVSRDAAFEQANHLALQIKRHDPTIGQKMTDAIEAGGNDIRRNRTVYRLVKNKVVIQLELKLGRDKDFKTKAKNALFYHGYLRPEDLK